MPGNRICPSQSGVMANRGTEMLHYNGEGSSTATLSDLQSRYCAAGMTSSPLVLRTDNGLTRRDKVTAKPGAVMSEKHAMCPMCYSAVAATNMVPRPCRHLVVCAVSKISRDAAGRLLMARLMNRHVTGGWRVIRRSTVVRFVGCRLRSGYIL